MSNYHKTEPLTVIMISFLGIFFWMRFCEIFEPILGKNFYINIIADNTYSIMINHSLSQDIIRYIFFFISKYTKYCKNFDKKRFFNMDPKYIYIPSSGCSTKYPSSSDKKLIKKYGSTVYSRCDKNVVLISDGKNIEIKTNQSASDYKR